MEKDLKIAELANIWGTSVPTVWNRIKKHSLTTVKKQDENNKEVTYVRISEEILKKYIVNVNNNINNVVNNGYYEDMLNVNNVNNDIKTHENDIIDTEYTISKNNQITEVINTLTSVNNDYNERLTTLYEDNYNQLQTINNDYNNRLQELSKELVDYKSKALLLEDKAGREGYYINEINILKKDYKGLSTTNERLKYIIAILAILIVGLLTYLITVNNLVKNLSHQVNNVQEEVINDKKPAEVQEVVTPQAPQQAKNANIQRKRK